MSKKAVALLLALSLMLYFISCDNAEPAATLSPSQQETPTNTPMPTATQTPWAPYKTMNVGSSKTLQGTCLFIRVYLSDKESHFTENAKQDSFYFLRGAIYYLSHQAEKYNQALTFIYNEPDTVIDYNIDYIIPRNYEGWNYNELISEIYSLYNVDALVEKYNADNVAFILHINKVGRAFAVQSKKDVELNEAAIIYRYSGNEIPDGVQFTRGDSPTYIHELLHLFGAIDLYTLDDKRLALAKQYFPNDCMLVGDVDFSDDSTSIGPLTAYLIGWTEELNEKYQVFLQ